MKINPMKDSNQDNSSSTRRPSVTSGNKIFAPVGVSYLKPKDKLILEITSVVIKDLEDKEEEGAMHRETFWLTAAASWKIANWSIAMGNSEPFDASSREDIERIIANGVAFHGLIKVEDDNGYTKRQIDNFYRPRDIINKAGEVEISEDSNSLIQDSEVFFSELIKIRKKNGVKFIESDSNKDDSDSEIPF